jgi:UDP-N-acetylenolpyruvoylglucosamine reductase
LSEGEACNWKDLIFLIGEAKKRVQEEFGVDLENEVRIIKNNQ